MSLVNSRPDLFIYFIKIEFECGTYFAFTDEDPISKVDKIIKDARKHYCEHDIVDTTYIEFPKKYLCDLENKLNSVYVMYCGCCAFGA